MGGLEMKASMERTLVAAIAGSAIGQEKICDRLAICKFCDDRCVVLHANSSRFQVFAVRTGY
jgi:hypothetical protein